MGSVGFQIFHVPKMEQCQEQGHFFDSLVIHFCIHELFAMP